MRKIACAVALALGTGCAVNTDPVLANADAGFPGSDAGLGPALTGFEAVMPYAGCDVDLACTEGCDEDLDCANAAGGELDERLAELDDATSMVMGEAAEAWLALGTAATSLQSASYWRHLLTNAGFHIRREQEPGGLVLCLRADKPPATTGQQLRLNLQLDDHKGQEAEGNRGRGGFFSA